MSIPDNIACAADPALVVQDGYLRVSPPPAMPLRELLARVEALGALVRCRAATALLVDMRALPHLGATEQVLLSHHCGQHLRGARVAVLVPGRTGLGQRAARAQGLDLRSFDEDEEDWAVDWLHGEG